MALEVEKIEEEEIDGRFTMMVMVVDSPSIRVGLGPGRAAVDLGALRRYAP